LLDGSTQAANLTWDASGSNPAAPTDGAGTWDTSTGNWSNGSTDVAWTNASDVAVFGRNGNAGAVTLAGATTLGGISFNSTASGSYTIAAGGGSLVGVTGKSMTLSASANVTGAIAAPIIGANGAFNSIEINGPGVIVLTGANSFVGPILNINAGATLSVPVMNNGSVDGPLGRSSGGLRLQGGILQFTGSTTTTCANALKIYAAGGTYDMEGSGVMNIGNHANGTGTMSANRTIALTGNTTAANQKSGYGQLQSALLEWSGTITNNAKTSLLKTGTGSWYLAASTASTYSGTTTIQSGRLGIMLNNALPATTTVILGKAGVTAPAMLDLGPVVNVSLGNGVSSYNLTVAGLSALGNDLTQDVITNNDTSSAGLNHVATLTVNPDGAGASAADSTFGGLLTNGGTSQLALTKAGSHSLTLVANNTYSGGTNLTGGTLRTAATGNLGTGNVNVSAGTLELDNNTSIADTANLTVAAGGVLNLQFTSTAGNASTYEAVASLNLGGTVINTPTIFSAADYHGFDAYFAGSNSTAVLQVIPEPGSIIALAVCATGLLVRRQRQRSASDSITFCYA
jgi:autotransporter-associated beta strand protein